MKFANDSQRRAVFSRLNSRVNCSEYDSDRFSNFGRETHLRSGCDGMGSFNSFSFSNRFVRPDYLKGNRQYVSVEVSVPKFENAWKNNPQNHFEKEDVSDPKRFDGVEEFIEEGKRIDMPEVFAEPSLESVKVADGRHRIAALRDLGHKKMKILVPEFQKDYFESNFGVRT